MPCHGSNNESIQIRQSARKDDAKCFIPFGGLQEAQRFRGGHHATDE